MVQTELQETLAMFADGTGFGDPEAHQNAESRLRVAMAQQQAKTAARLNHITLMIAVVGLLQTVILGFQVWGK